MKPVFALEPDNDSDSKDRMPRLKGALGKGEDLGPFLGSSLPGNDSTFVFNPMSFFVCLFPISLGAQINGHPFLPG